MSETIQDETVRVGFFNGPKPFANGTKLNVNKDGDLKCTINPRTSYLASAYGEIMVAERRPQFVDSFPIRINPETWKIRSDGTSGSCTVTNSECRLSTGTDTNGTCFMQTRRYGYYPAGQGLVTQFSARFTAGVSGSTQEYGYGIPGTHGFFVGYSGATFCLFRYNNGILTTYKQQDWNVDTLSRSSRNPSNIILDPTKSNVYILQKQFHFMGKLSVFVVVGGQTIPQLAHVIEFQNNNTGLSIPVGSLPITAKVTKTSGSQDVSIYTGSFGLFTQGYEKLVFPIFTVDNAKSSVSSEVLICQIRVKETDLGVTNYTPIYIHSVGAASEDDNNTSIIRIYKNTLFSGTASYSDVDTGASMVESDIASTTPLSDVSGTTQGGNTATTFVLEVLDVNGDDYYNGWILVIVTATTGRGQTREILDYNSTTKVVTVSTWGDIPSDDATYQLHNLRKIRTFPIGRRSNEIMIFQNDGLVLSPGETLSVTGQSQGGTATIVIAINWYELR